MIEHTHQLPLDNPSSRTVANFAISLIDDTFKALGLPRNGMIEEIVYACFVILISLLIGYVVRFVILKVWHFILVKKNMKIDNEAQAYRTIKIATYVLVPLIYLSLMPWAFPKHSVLLNDLMMIGVICLIISIAFAINIILRYVWQRYDSRENVHNHPLKGLLQVSQGAIWIIAIILIVSLLIHKSPVALLTGLGAFAAVLMLVFKDSILGVVAGVQLSENDMLRVGDWIKVPGTLANGIVVDVSLTVVKIRNFDNTIIMLPPYSLISNSFQNYRGMTDSGVRQIACDITIDVDSIRFTTPEMLEEFKKIPMMNDYITAKQKQAAEGKECNVNNPDGLADGTIDTNIGCLRAYIRMYIDSHPLLSHDPALDSMVIPQNPTAEGLPLQVYCFTNTTKWMQYEAIKGEILEHINAIVPRFGLHVYESPSGLDLRGVTQQLAAPTPAETTA